MTILGMRKTGYLEYPQRKERVEKMVEVWMSSPGELIWSPGGRANKHGRQAKSSGHSSDFAVFICNNGGMSVKWVRKRGFCNALLGFGNVECRTKTPKDPNQEIF